MENPAKNKRVSFAKNPKAISDSRFRNSSSTKLKSKGKSFLFKPESIEDNLDNLIEILKLEPNKRTHDDIMQVCNYISKTQFFEKLRKENFSEESFDTLNYNFSLNLGFCALKKDEILFRINDIGDKFYVIIKGNLAILKVSIERKTFSNRNYISFLKRLDYENENYLLSKTMMENKEKIHIINKDDLKHCEFIIAKTAFDQDEFHSLINDLNFTMKRFEQVLTEKKIRLQDLDIDLSTLNEFIEIKKELNNYFSDDDEIGNKINNNNNRIFNNNNDKSNMNKGRKGKILDKKYKKLYDKLKAKMTLTQEESIFYEKNKSFFLFFEREQEYILAVYENFLTLSEGKFFGDLALDKVDKLRTATVKALEDNTILGFIPNEVYKQHLTQEKNKLRMREVLFLQQNFFFRTVKANNFSRKHFDNFVALDYRRGFVINNYDCSIGDLYFIREGVFDIYIESNVFELNELMKKIIFKFYELMSSLGNKKNIYNKESLLKKFTLDFNLRFKSEKYIESLYKRKSFNVSLLSTNDLIGIEPTFLETKCFYKAVVHSEKAQIYKIDVNKFNSIINIEFHSKLDFIEFSEKRILSFLERASNVLKCFHDKINFSLIEDGKEMQKNKKTRLQLKIGSIFQANGNENEKENENGDLEILGNNNTEYLNFRSNLNTNPTSSEIAFGIEPNGNLKLYSQDKNIVSKEKKLLSKTALANYNSFKENSTNNTNHNLPNIDLSSKINKPSKNQTTFTTSKNFNLENQQRINNHKVIETSKNIIINYQKFKINSEKLKGKNLNNADSSAVNNLKNYVSQASINTRNKFLLTPVKEARRTPIKNIHENSLEQNQSNLEKTFINQNKQEQSFYSPINTKKRLRLTIQSNKNEDDFMNRNYINKRRTLFDNYNRNFGPNKQDSLIVEDFLKQDSYISNSKIDMDSQFFNIVNNKNFKYSTTNKLNMTSNFNSLNAPKSNQENGKLLAVDNYKVNSNYNQEENEDLAELDKSKDSIEYSIRNKFRNKELNAFLKATQNQKYKLRIPESNGDSNNQSSEIYNKSNNFSPLKLESNKSVTYQLKLEDIGTESNQTFTNSILALNFKNNSYDYLESKNGEIDKREVLKQFSLIPPIINSNENKEILGLRSLKRKNNCCENNNIDDNNYQYLKIENEKGDKVSNINNNDNILDKNQKAFEEKEKLEDLSAKNLIKIDANQFEMRTTEMDEIEKHEKSIKKELSVSSVKIDRKLFSNSKQVNLNNKKDINNIKSPKNKETKENNIFDLDNNIHKVISNQNKFKIEQNQNIISTTFKVKHLNNDKILILEKQHDENILSTLASKDLLTVPKTIETKFNFNEILFNKFEKFLAKNTLGNHLSKMALMNFGLNEKLNKEENLNENNDNSDKVRTRSLNSIAILKKKKENLDKNKKRPQSNSFKKKKLFKIIKSPFHKNEENKILNDLEEFDQSYNFIGNVNSIENNFDNDVIFDLNDTNEQKLFSINQLSAAKVFQDTNELLVKEEIVDAVKNFFKERNSKGIINYLGNKNSFVLKVKNNNVQKIVEQ